MPPSAAPILLALYEPDIAQNAGAMFRSCACLGVDAAIIEPAGFRIGDSRFRRAAMDYLERVPIAVHDFVDEVRGLAPNGAAPARAAHNERRDEYVGVCVWRRRRDPGRTGIGWRPCRRRQRRGRQVVHPDPTAAPLAERGRRRHYGDDRGAAPDRPAAGGFSAGLNFRLSSKTRRDFDATMGDCRSAGQRTVDGGGHDDGRERAGSDRGRPSSGGWRTAGSGARRGAGRGDCRCARFRQHGRGARDLSGNGSCAARPDNAGRSRVFGAAVSSVRASLDPCYRRIRQRRPRRDPPLSGIWRVGFHSKIHLAGNDAERDRPGARWWPVDAARFRSGHASEPRLRARSRAVSPRSRPSRFAF